MKVLVLIFVSLISFANSFILGDLLGLGDFGAQGYANQYPGYGGGSVAPFGQQHHSRPDFGGYGHFPHNPGYFGGQFGPGYGLQQQPIRRRGGNFGY